MLCMRFRKSRHSVFHTEYHIVWTPRYRRKIFVKGVKEYLAKLLRNVDGLDSDIEVSKVNVQLDHVHLVMINPPRLSLASVMQFMKFRTGKKLWEKFDFTRRATGRGGGIWFRGHCVSTIGMNQRTIMRYVEHQEREDKDQLSTKLNL